jgi:hypothetical protein
MLMGRKITSWKPILRLVCKIAIMAVVSDGHKLEAYVTGKKEYKLEACFTFMYVK